MSSKRQAQSSESTSISVLVAFAHWSALETPKSATNSKSRAAAVLALTSEHRLFIHRARHTSRSMVNNAVTLVNVKKEIDPRGWVEIEYTDYLVYRAVILKDGTVLNHGFKPRKNGTEFEETALDVVVEGGPQVLNVRPNKYGYELLPQS